MIAYTIVTAVLALIGAILLLIRSGKNDGEVGDLIIGLVLLVIAMWGIIIFVTGH